MTWWVVVWVLQTFHTYSHRDTNTNQNCVRKFPTSLLDTLYHNNTEEESINTNDTNDQESVYLEIVTDIAHRIMEARDFMIASSGQLCTRCW